MSKQKYLFIRKVLRDSKELLVITYVIIKILTDLGLV